MTTRHACAVAAVLALLPTLWRDSVAQAPLDAAAIVAAPIVGRVYPLPERTIALPDFSALAPEGSFTTCRIDVPRRGYRQGFPAVVGRTEWFAIEYSAAIEVVSPGAYRFELSSDDGSRLYIDGEMVLDNDGIHEAYPVDAVVMLERGPHAVRLEYMQGPRFEIALVLRWSFGRRPLEVFAYKGGTRRM